MDILISIDNINTSKNSGLIVDFLGGFDLNGVYYAKENNQDTFDSF